MKSKILETLGIDPGIILIIMTILLIVALVIAICATMNYRRLKVSYNSFMRGKDGKTLENSLKEKFDEVETVLRVTKQNRQDIKDMSRILKRNFHKFGIVKYDAFNEMGGKLSFAIAMLDGNNSGWIINAMHSREGCYTYIKEIIKGESYIELAEEEAEALDKAIFENPYDVEA
jgi:hypothetical protein